jgi:hypothetical protein
MLLASAGSARASNVRHVAPAEANPGSALVLTATVSRAWETTIEVRYRPLGATAWASAEFRREGDTEYTATIPSETVRPPGLEYFIVDHFASAEDPHRVNVYQDRKTLWRESVLERRGDRRARVHLSAQYVDYGSREIREHDIPDRYYRLDADFSYLLLNFPLKALRFGYTRMLGETPYSSRGQDTGCPAGGDAEECTFDAGFKVGGWFELGFAIRDGIELDARGMVMATSEGFNVGGRGEFRVGVVDSTHVALGGESISEVGNAAFVRLGWGTVPGFPMAATVEVTDFPAEHRATAVRLLYDVARPFEGGFRVGLRLGYQARDQQVGGVTAGLNTTFDF